MRSTIPAIGKLADAYEDWESVRLRFGVRPSGTPHLGTMHVLYTAFIIGEEMARRGHNVGLTISTCDLQLPYSHWDFGVPLKYYRPDEAGQSLGERGSAYVRELAEGAASFLEQSEGARVPFSIVPDSALQSSGDFRRMLAGMIENEDAKLLLKPLAGSYPAEPLCPRCHRINRTSYRENGRLYSRCGRDRTEMDVDIRHDTDIELSLDYSLASAMRTAVLRPDVHVIGRDHVDILKGSLDRIKRLTKLAGADMPSYFVTTLYMHGYKKLSKSARRGPDLELLRKRYGGDYVRPAMGMVRHVLERGWHEVQSERALKIMDRLARGLYDSV